MPAEVNGRRRPSGFRGDFRQLIPERAREEIEYLEGLPEEERAAALDERYRADRERRAADLRKQYRRESGLVGEMLERTFESFAIRDGTQDEARRIARLFVDRLPKVRRGLMLWGPSGRGKSHLLKAVLNAGLAKADPVKPIYVSCLTIGDLKREERSFMRRLLDAEGKGRPCLLGLDDVDKSLGGAAAEWSYEATVQVLDELDKRGWPPAIATSEYALDGKMAEDLQQKLRAEGASPEEIERAGVTHEGSVKPYLIGRLRNLFHWQLVAGPDGRDPQYWEGDAAWWA